MLTAARLREVLVYDPTSGVFTWRVARGRAPAGAVAGQRSRYGYTAIRVDRVLYAAHRLAWLYVHSVWPPDEIDHRDGVRNNNRLNNLRAATRGENMQNVVSPRDGMQGTFFRADRGRWKASIKINQRATHLGFFDTEVEARHAYLRAKAELHTFSPVPRV